MISSTPCACTTVRKANRSLFRYYDKELGKAGITVTQFAMLRAIERKGTYALSRLADELIMERTSLYRSLSHLEESGDVTIFTSKENKKIKLAELTPKGIKTIQLALPYWQTAQDKVVGLIGKDKWAELSEVLLDIPELIHSIS